MSGFRERVRHSWRALGTDSLSSTTSKLIPILEVLKEVSVVFPPLQAATSGLLAAANHIDVGHIAPVKESSCIVTNRKYLGMRKKPPN